MNEDAIREFKEIITRLGALTLVKGVVNDQQFWAYVSIPLSKFEAFIAAEQAGNYTLTDYGNVLEYGLGTQKPPKSIKRKIEKTYGIDHDMVENMREMYKTLDIKMD